MSRMLVYCLFKSYTFIFNYLLFYYNVTQDIFNNTMPNFNTIIIIRYNHNTLANIIN